MFYQVYFRRIKQLLQTNYGKFLDIVYPQFCLGCGQEGSCLCPNCLSLIEITERRFCPFCSSADLFNGRCSRHQNQALDGLDFAVGEKNFLLEEALTKFKSPPYCQGLAVPLASLIVAHLQLRNYQKSLFQQSPALVPIPLHRKRERERGFNQSLLLAKQLAQEFSLPIRCHWLQRQKNTLSQEGLNLKERQENLEGAFCCPSPGLVTDQKIILIDDVFTSGATIKKAAQVLKNEGARFVWGITIARCNFPA